MSWIKGWRRRFRALLQGETVDRELNDEVAFHLDMETAKNIRSGMSAEQARRAAALAFGGVEKFKQEVRETRWLAWVDSLALDVKLGVRMLVKYPGLALVGGLGMAVAIAIAALSFGVISAFVDPSLPFDEGDRVVSIQNWDSRRSQPNRQALHDFEIWRRHLTGVTELGASRMFEQNLVDERGSTEPVRVAEITASAFDLARTKPLLGRYLVESDQAVGAPAVAVIGFDVWRRRFNGEPAVVGKTLRLGSNLYTVVGVMPDGFGFPVNQSLWTPLRRDIFDVERASGPEIHVFGRRAPGTSLNQAQAELAAIGASLAAQYPDTHGSLQPQVLPYTYPFVDLNDPDSARWLRILQAFVIVIVIYVCANVAIVVYARTAARSSEFAVRTALGGSRQRVVLQLVFEALVLSVLAAAVGTAIAAAALRGANTLELGTDGLPFWMEFGLSPGTFVYVTWLAIVAAAIIGVVPALKVTRGDIEARLRASGSRSTGMELGRVWNGLIVGQVAMTVTVLPLAAFTLRETSRHAMSQPGFPTHEYLSAPLYLDDVARSGAYNPEHKTRYADVQAEVLRRLQEEPWVVESLVTGTVPGQALRGGIIMDASAGTDRRLIQRGADSNEHVVGVNRVPPGFFDAFGVPLVAGRQFGAADASPTARVAIVNRSFARDIAGGAHVLGRRVRQPSDTVDGRQDAAPGAWYEIVGIVDDLKYPDSDVPAAAIYLALVPGEGYPASLLVRTRGTAPPFAPARLRAIAAAIDPSVRLGSIATLDESRRQEQVVWRVVSIGVGFLTASVLLLSAAGIYALMSFTVTKQRRDIGLRVALGAQRDRLLWNIFSRSARQLVGGVLLGLAVAALVDWGFTDGELLRGQGIVLVPAAGLLMVTVGLLAAAGPARRALRIQPTEALHEL
jgi:putative ABC transport system permease protein